MPQSLSPATPIAEPKRVQTARRSATMRCSKFLFAPIRSALSQGRHAGVGVGEYHHGEAIAVELALVNITIATGFEHIDVVGCCEFERQSDIDGLVRVQVSGNAVRKNIAHLGTPSSTVQRQKIYRNPMESIA